MEQQLNGIKNIIFDLGGVLLDLDIEKTVRAFQALGLKDVIKPGGWGYRNKLFTDMEKGLITENEFRDQIRDLLPNPATDQEIDDAWCAMLIGFQTPKIELLKYLQHDYRIFLFSNTNSIHLEYFRKLYRDTFGTELDDLFSKAFYSHELKTRKPDLEAFLDVIQKGGMVAHESLFIDDSKMNIEAAKGLGIQTYWLKNGNELTTFFSRQL